MISSSIIDYFRKGPVASDRSENLAFNEVNAISAPLGWIVHPDCCNKSVLAWLKTLTKNYNATFYKEWNDVVSKTRLELLLDQLLHYASTYGQLLQGKEPEGNGYVPNSDPMTPMFKKFKMLEPISEDELVTKCIEVLQSGIALKEKTMKDICDFWNDRTKESIDRDELAKILSTVKNKEALVYLCDKTNTLPADEFGMLRMLIYKHTGSTMLIKSKATIASVKTAAAAMDPSSKSKVSYRSHRSVNSSMHSGESPLLSLTHTQMERLSKIFLRFKPLFLAMKTKATASIINSLRRLAVKNHKPFSIGMWESIVSNPRPIEEVKKHLPELDSWRKIRLMMVLKEHMNHSPKNGVFVIRNGKMFVRENYKPKFDRNWMSQLYFAIEESLVESLKPKACTVKFPEGYEIALPTSEKNFVGNFPYGTSFTLTRNNVLGVYWRNEWGTRDYDLSMVDISGTKIGWNSSYFYGSRGVISPSRGQVIYSGDMTNADPEAVELLYIEDSAPDGIIKLNKFAGVDDSKFRFFFANEVMDKTNIRGHMVDPNNIKFDTMIDFQGQGEKTIGMLLNGRFTLMDFNTGNRRVSYGGKYVDTIVESAKNKADSFIPLKETLLRAGFKIWEPAKEGEEHVEPDIDFTNLEKDTLIKLLS